MMLVYTMKGHTLTPEMVKAAEEVSDFTFDPLTRTHLLDEGEGLQVQGETCDYQVWYQGRDSFLVMQVERMVVQEVPMSHPYRRSERS